MAASRLLSLPAEVLDRALAEALSDVNCLLNVRTAKALLCCCSRAVTEALDRIKQSSEEIRSIVSARGFTPLSHPNVLAGLEPEGTVYVDWRTSAFGFMASRDQLDVVLKEVGKAVPQGRIMLRTDLLAHEHSFDVPSVVRRIAVEWTHAFGILKASAGTVEVVIANNTQAVLLLVGEDTTVERVISNGKVGVISIAGFCCQAHKHEFGDLAGAGFWLTGHVDVKAHINRCNR